MASTTARYPIKAKSLTLLELCQTINDFRSPLSRNTAQISTRRLYLHPLTISSNAKQHSPKILSNHSLDLEHFNQTNLEKRNPPHKHKPHGGLKILSSSFPLLTRMNTKTIASTITDDHTTHEANTTTISSNHLSLPPINRGASSSSKRTVSTRTSYITNQPKKHFNDNHQWEKMDVWQHLARALQRPTPKDPPTTPLDMLSDFHLQNVEQQEPEQKPNRNFIQEIKIYKRSPTCDSVIDENNEGN
jgi:hypothetical protein